MVFSQNNRDTRINWICDLHTERLVMGPCERVARLQVRAYRLGKGEDWVHKSERGVDVAGRGG